MATEPMSQMPVFSSRSAFWQDLRAAANHHLAAEARAGRPRTGDPRVLRKAAVIIAWFGISYGALLVAPTFFAALLLTLSYGLAAAGIGFCIFHDANHRTLFRSPAANLRAAQLCSVLLGPSRQFWVHKHQGLHHRQPNVVEWDDDIETRGFLRLSPESSWDPRHRRQEVKALFYYGLNSLEWIFLKDFHCLTSGRLNAWHESSLSRQERTELIVCKGLYLLLIVLPPFLVLPFAWAAVAFVLFHFVLSWTLAAVFQLAHFTAEMEFGGVREGDDWAIHQIRTTADFATTSPIVNWFTGGLNHQVEHHLFPNVAHSHYPALRPIVRKVAQRNGLRCHDLGSMPSAIRKHLAHLKVLGANA
ncbi:MAG: acyl-CoA desaturase [Sphingomicrobium sp.]